MSFDLEAAVARQLESVKGRILVPVLEDDGTKSSMWYLRYPDQRAQSTLIIFSPEGIIITGDLCPGENRGVVSDYGYGLSWFVQDLNPDYLAEKFLRKRFVFEVADQEFRETVRGYVECGDMTAELGEKALSDWGEVDPEDESEALDVCEAYFAQHGIDDFGMWYDPHEMKLLVATQRQFAELYWALKGVEAA